MATLKQIEANRLNAQRSTGPRTEAGQAASSQNSRRHGCYSSQVVIEGQDQEQFNLLQDEFMDELQPQTLRERNLVEMMAVEWWHLGQCEFMRQSFFANQRKMVVDYHPNWAVLSEPERTKLVGENIAFYHLKDMNRISELKNRVFRSYHRASREFDRARDERLRRQAETETEAAEEAAVEVAEEAAVEVAEEAATEAEPQPLPQFADVPVVPAEPQPDPLSPRPSGRTPIPGSAPAPITHIRFTPPGVPGDAPQTREPKPAGPSAPPPAIDQLLGR